MGFTEFGILLAIALVIGWFILALIDAIRELL
jgi:hypothetical protein